MKRIIKVLLLDSQSMMKMKESVKNIQPDDFIFKRQKTFGKLFTDVIIVVYFYEAKFILRAENNAK